MKQVIFIADFFVNEVFGGGEIVNEEIIKGLEKNGYTVDKIKCERVNKKQNLQNHELLIANFVSLPEDMKEFISNNCNYSIIEHDHKYVRERDVTSYPNYIVSPDKIINRKFYKNAKYVYCQSKLHSDVISKNIGLNNVVNLSTSIWSDEHLDIIEKSIGQNKIKRTAILNSHNPIKNTNLCIEYCESKNIEYDLIGPAKYEELMDILGKYEKVLILPGVLETFNRFLVEARMLGCKVITDNKNGSTSEDWFSRLKGKELLDFIRASKQSFIENFTSTPKLYKHELPLVSIITSKFKGDDHIESFLDNMINQTAFDSCELIIVDPTPGPPCRAIVDAQQKYKNIIYKKIENDPGIYGCWNIAIKLSNGKYITNANLDDKRADTHIEHHVRFLEKNKDIDLVYSEAYTTEKDFENYYNNSAQGRVYPIKEFSKENMVKCLPGCMPVWRADIHSNNEFFDETFMSAGDWEMWLRAIKNGSEFYKLPGVYGLYYLNPNGMSTNFEKQKERFYEEKRVFNKYKDIFGNEAEKFEGYFNR
jgi:hypothetical protein